MDSETIKASNDQAVEVSRDVEVRSYGSSMKKTKKSDSAFRTISEVAHELGVQQHVLRFWETKFSQVRPLKRGGGRRYYRPEDIELLRSIQHLLYTEGYTIKGVQKMLRSEGKKKVMKTLPEADNGNVQGASMPHSSQQPAASESPSLQTGQQQALRAMLDELKALRSYVASDE